MLPILIEKGIAVLLVGGMLVIGGIQQLNSNDIEITKINKTPGCEYIEGNYGDYEFLGKVHKDPSEFGIGKGRISKLWIGKQNPDGTATWELNYDRGWDVEPKTQEAIEMSNKIINELEKE